MLVVDDEPTVWMLVIDVLKDLGYTAIEATDGASGLSVQRSDVRVDLLATDIGLPGGMKGRHVADAARIARPALNGHLDPGMHVLIKPVAMETLACRIKGLLSL